MAKYRFELSEVVKILLRHEYSIILLSGVFIQQHVGRSKPIGFRARPELVEIRVFKNLQTRLVR